MEAMNIFQSISIWMKESLTFGQSAIASKAREAFAASPDEVSGGFREPHPQFTLTIQENLTEFLFWSFTTITIITIVLLVSIVRKFETWLDPILHKIKKFAPFIMQITLGAALIFSAFYSSLFGVELPLSLAFGSYAGVVQIGMIIGGAMLLAGIFPRVVGLFVMLLFILLMLEHGQYMVNYATHLGEATTIFLFGGTYQIMKSNFHPLPELRRSMELHLHKYKFLILRIFFGASLIYASIYTKYLHGSLALETVVQYNLTEYFPFDPTFLVLGALIIEILLGLFFMIGFEIRFAAVAYMIFLVLSIIFFQEAVWPHIILIGTCLAMFTHGYDRYTIGGRYLKQGNLEPIL